MRLQFLLLIALVALARPAPGGPPEHYDLASLVLSSRYVVLADRGPQRVVKNWVKGTTFRVRKVYKGPMLPGEEIEIFDSGYELDWKSVHRPPGADAATPPPLDPETVLFLRDCDWSAMAWLPEDAPRYMTVDSGMRILRAGKVYRFEVEEQPGPYAPVPQGRDPDDVFGRGILPGDIRGPVDLATFEEDLLRAIARAARVEGLLASRASAERDRRLLETLGPPRPFRPISFSGGFREAADLVARKIFEELSKAADPGAALDAFRRSHDRMSLRSGSGLPFVSLAAFALDRSKDRGRRVAALWLLERDALPPESAVLTLRPLLAEEDVELRQAAARFFGNVLHIQQSSPRRFRAEESRPLIDALTTCWETEEDPRVQAVILWEIRNLDLGDKLINGSGKRPRFLVAEIEELAVGILFRADLAYGALDLPAPRLDQWTLVVAEKDGREVQRTPLDRCTSLLRLATERPVEESRRGVEGVEGGPKAPAKPRKEVIEAIEGAAKTEWSFGSQWISREDRLALLPAALPEGTYRVWVEATLPTPEPAILRSRPVEIRVEQGKPK